MQTLICITMALLGIVIYYSVKVRQHLTTFSLTIFIKENGRTILYCVFVILLVALVLFIEPTANDLIKSQFGFDLTANSKSWFLVGIGIAASFRNVRKTKKRKTVSS